MFWFNALAKNSQLPLGLAPMDGITDVAFRQICALHAKPSVMFTEFVSVEGLCHCAPSLLKILRFTPEQQPIVAQLFGKTPACFYQAGILACELGFVGIDINMGCPVAKISANGSGAGLIKTPKLAQEIIKATKQAVVDWSNGANLKNCKDFSPIFIKQIELLAKLNRQEQLKPATPPVSATLPVSAILPVLTTPVPATPLVSATPLPPPTTTRQMIPVSVKTRLGYDQPIVKEWLSTLLAVKPDLITLHGRTLKQAYKGMADWQAIALGAEIAHLAQTPLWGNGDVANYEQAEEHIKQYHVDGILIGRASFGNPWAFLPQAKRLAISHQQRVKVAIEHTKLFEQFFANENYFCKPNKDASSIVGQKSSENKQKVPNLSTANQQFSFLPMRKHLAWYFKGFENVSQLRAQLMQANSSQDVEKILTML